MKTALYDRHVALGAKIVDFQGWQMPLQYPQGILHEHRTVRSKAGIFDVSHMGRIDIEGKDAEAFLDWLTTNRIASRKEGSATYTVMCNESGGTVDDLIVYRLAANRFFVVVNAGCRDKDLQHILSHKKNYRVNITPRYADMGILAVQGPCAKPLVEPFFPTLATMKPMQVTEGKYREHPLTIATTGYTGAGGCEIIADPDTIVQIWDLLLKEEIEPIGLGARDTLRLEKGFALYGHELSEEICPLESVAAWAVRMDKTDFLGKKALQEKQSNGSLRHSCAVILKDKGIPRADYAVYSGDEKIGIVTSGGFSPSLKTGIALLLVDRKLQKDDTVHIQVRQSKLLAVVV